MDYNDIQNALKQSNDDFNNALSAARGASQDRKQQAKDEAMNKALVSEGFRPYITPTKQEVWLPKPKVASDNILTYQKATASMSPELLLQTYPFLQYAVKNFIPNMDELIEGVQNQTFSYQYLQEMTLAMAQGGLEEAIKATGGHAAQGKGSIANSSSAKETAEIIMKEKKAYEQLTKVSDYAANGFTGVNNG